MAWPKLSETLPAATSTQLCQKCGRECDLHRWREHDEADQPTPVVIVLCIECEKIIAPHPRLYSKLQFHEPHPGSMPLCEDCKSRQGLACTHKDLFSNGGPGLKLEFPEPSVAHIKFDRGGKFMTVYKGPVKCGSREEVA